MAIQEKYDEDTVILNEKGISRQMYMVLSGTVALYINYGKPDEYLLGLCNKGTVFGEMGALCHMESMYTAVAVNETEVAIFSEFELSHFVGHYPEQALGIMRSIARVNKVLSINMKMLMKENEEDAKMIEMLSDVMKAKLLNESSLEENM